MDYLTLAETRRSVRAFTDEPVTDTHVDQLLRAAIAAPSAGNRQAWHFIVVRDHALKEAFATKATQQSFIATAPVVIVVCTDPRQNEDRYAERGEHLFAIQDTSAAIQNILLAATSLGLGTCWCGGFDESVVAATLKLPKHIRPVALIPVGHPAGALPEPTPRRPLSEVVEYR
ncbi:MAG: nitroreductase family protein [Promicromonosporaceae bacterium]|nr:nitroreductase family protein [Promicromonosporaceae bacterium]